MNHTVHYSWSEYTALAQQSKKSGKALERDRDWAGCTFAQAVKMATVEGYASKVTEAENIAGAVSTNVLTDVLQETFQATWDVAGAEVDMGRFLAGAPECMVESQPIKIARAGRAVRIAVPVGYSSSVPAEQILRRGACVVALALVLQQMKHPLEIWAGFCTDRSGYHYAQMAQVQRADEPFDIGRVMYALAHPSMLRQLGFAVADMQPEAVRQFHGMHRGGGYGRGYAIHEDDLDQSAGTTIIVPDNDRGMSWTVQESVRWIEQQLDRIFGEEV